MRRLTGIVLLLAVAAWGQASGGKSYYDPGWNLFSPQQDVQLGQDAAAQAEKQLPILRNAAATRYLTTLGLALAAHMPGPKFPYNFHLVNQKDINAFALPGGPIFVNVGAVCAADNEAELAGVVAHEESHVALRHSTSMASKKQLASVPLSILGGLINSNLANMAAQMVVGGVFLKYSRDMESQADALGAQVMNAAGYDPREMAAFFEKLEKQGGSQTVQFLSDHPDPGNRREAIEKEIPTLGPHPPYHDDSAAFEETKKALCSGAAPAQDQTPANAPATNGVIAFQGVHFQTPAGWNAYGDPSKQVTLAPKGGLQQSGNSVQIMTGVIVGTFTGSAGQLLSGLRQSNPQMRPAGASTAVRAGGLDGASLLLSNRNSTGQQETDRLVTFPRSGASSIFFLFVAPSSQYQQLSPVFDQILQSLRS